MTHTCPRGFKCMFYNKPRRPCQGSRVHFLPAFPKHGPARIPLISLCRKQLKPPGTVCLLPSCPGASFPWLERGMPTWCAKTQWGLVGVARHCALWHSVPAPTSSIKQDGHGQMGTPTMTMTMDSFILAACDTPDTRLSQLLKEGSRSVYCSLLFQHADG